MRSAFSNLSRGALAAAATLAAAVLIVPWLNFAYLPRAGSALSLLGSVGAVLALALLVPLLLRDVLVPGVEVVVVPGPDGAGGRGHGQGDQGHAGDTETHARVYAALAYFS